MIILIGGGSRSGKSRFAVTRARQYEGSLAFIATAQTLDEEMATRAAAHKEQRGPNFTTIEEPYELARVLETLDGRYGAVIVDCLTLWLSNLMLGEPPRDVPAATREALRAAAQTPVPVLMVTNEVGCGIVPENELARRFRDAAGSLNQQAAEAAVEVYWMAFGCPLRLK